MNSTALLREVNSVGNLVKTIDIAREEYDELRRLQVKLRSGWHAVFSTNPSGEKIWPFTRYTLTPKPDRVLLSGSSQLLDKLVDELLRVKPEGGRFFINEDGAFWKPKEEWGQKFQFVRFRFRDDMRLNSRPVVVGFVHGR